MYHDKLKINQNRKRRIIVIDDFYENPYEVRDFALSKEFILNNNLYKGRRTEEQFLTEELKSEFEKLIDGKITNWKEHAMNGRFQYCIAGDSLVYHNDSQKWAGVLYLTPDAPFETGTSLLCSKISKCRNIDENDKCGMSYRGGFYDSTKFEVVDNIGNVFNRLIIFDARCIHAASNYFGTNKNDSRLFQLFFFD